MKHLARSLVFSVACLAPNVYAASAYTVQDLGTLGGTDSFATALNDHGTVVGTAYDASNQFQAFVYENGVMNKVTNDDNGQAWGINNAGQIVGDGSGIRNGNSRNAFIYDNGVVTSVNLPPLLGSLKDINESGISVGYSITNPGGRGFVHDNGTSTELQQLPTGFGYSLNSPVAINDHGVVIGRAGNAGFIYANGQMQCTEDTIGEGGRLKDINNAGDIVGRNQNSGDAFLLRGDELFTFSVEEKSTSFEAINNAGTAVGYYYGDYSSLPGESTAVLLDSDGTLIELQSLIVGGDEFDFIARASDINEKGQIVGYGFIDGERHAYLLNPVPVPAAAWFFGSAVLSLVGIFRSKNPRNKKTFKH